MSLREETGKYFLWGKSTKDKIHMCLCSQGPLLRSNKEIPVDWHSGTFPLNNLELNSFHCSMRRRKERMLIFFRKNTKWRMTPVLWEGPEAPGALAWEAVVTSAEASAAAYGTGGWGCGRGRAEAAELTEARPRTRSGSPSPSWAACSRTWRSSPWRRSISFLCPSRNLRSLTFSWGHKPGPITSAHSNLQLLVKEPGPERKPEKKPKPEGQSWEKHQGLGPKSGPLQLVIHHTKSGRFCSSPGLGWARTHEWVS